MLEDAAMVNISKPLGKLGMKLDEGFGLRLDRGPRQIMRGVFFIFTVP